MIIYGWNSKNIKQAELEAYNCPECGEKQSAIAIFSHYVHIFWIPIFPYKKSAKIACGHCQLATEEKSMPEEMKETIGQLKSSVSTPKSLFSGLLLLMIAVAFFSFRSFKNEQLEQSYIESPQIGDVYVLKDLEESSEYKHYFMKLNEIENDSLWVSFNSYSYTGIITELDPRDGFYNYEYPIHKSALQEFQQSGELKKIIRDYSSAAGFDRIVEYEPVDTVDTIDTEMVQAP